MNIPRKMSRHGIQEEQDSRESELAQAALVEDRQARPRGRATAVSQLHETNSVRNRRPQTSKLPRFQNYQRFDIFISESCT